MDCLMKPLLTLLFILSFTLLKASTITTSDRVVNSVNIRATASATSERVGRLLLFESAELLGTYVDYYKIRTSTGITGFVSKSWTVKNVDAKTLKLTMYFIDVNQGDATLINCPNGNNILVDMGSSSPIERLSLKNLRQYFLKSLTDNKKLQTFIITHPDKDHYSLADDIIGEIPIDYLFYIGEEADYSADKELGGEQVFDSWFSGLQTTKYRPHRNDFDIETHQNETIDCGEADIHLLAADTHTNNTAWASNASSISIMVRYKNFEAILTGVGTFEVESKIEDRYDDDWLNVDLFKLGHHGSSSSSNSKRWLSLLKPKIIIRSSGLITYMATLKPKSLLEQESSI